MPVIVFDRWMRAVVATAVVGLCSASSLSARQSDGSPGGDTAPAEGAGATQAVVPGSELRVWLVTAAPGDAVWERYGHNAIRVLDTGTGRDVSYNWGIFDFQQVDFIPRFLRGRMLYMMAVFPTGPMIEAYARADREVVLQELDMTPAEKAELRELAEINALPENRDYFYQYFRDNCSTRVRDLLDAVLGGAIEAGFGATETGTNYRYHTRRLTHVDPLVYTGMDALLGTPADAQITVWEEMFIPMTLRDELRGFERIGPDGSMTPLVLSEEIAAPSTRPSEPSAPPRWFPVYLAIGLLLGLVLASPASRRFAGRKGWLAGVAVVRLTWTVLGGVLGTILVLLMFTDHSFAWWNENLFLFNPVLLLLAVALVVSALGRGHDTAVLLAKVIAGIALVGLAWQFFPMSLQQNAIFLAIALPAHVGMVAGLAGAARRGPDVAKTA